MKKLILSLLLLVGLASAQSFYRLSPPVPGGVLRVCPVESGNPCASPAPIFSDKALTQVIVQPVMLGIDGNYGFWTSPGQYLVQISSPFNRSEIINLAGPNPSGSGGGGIPSSTVAVAPATINFGTVQNNTPSPAQNFAITNTGASIVVVQSCTTNNTKFTIVNPAICTNVSLLAGAAVVPQIAYTPTGAGSDIATLTVTTTAPIDLNNPLTVALSGTGTATPTFPLNILNLGPGGGTVVSDDGLINCSFVPPNAPAGLCNGSYISGATPTLTATPYSGSTLGGLSGAGCPNSPTQPSCQITISAATTVTATFNVTTPTQVLNIATVGQGGGTVVSDVSNSAGIINCGLNAGVTSPSGGTGCSGRFPQGTPITLTLTPNGSSTFVSCSGITNCTSPITFTLNADTTVTYNLTPTAVPISLVQTVTNCSVASTTIACLWGSAQSAGDLLMCSGGWPDATTTVSSVSDTKGNTYTQVPTVSPKVGTGLTQVEYYAQNIVAATAGSNTTTMTLSAAVPSVSATALTISGDAVSSSTFTTASITLPNNSLILVSAGAKLASGNGPGTISSITGCSATFVKITGSQWGNGQGTGFDKSKELWRTLGNGNTCTLVITWSGTAPTQHGASVTAFSGTDLTGTNGSGAIGIVSTAFQNNTAVASPASLTMGTFGSSANGTYCTTDLNTSVSSFTAGSGMTLLNSRAGSAVVSADEWAAGNIATPQMAYSGSTAEWAHYCAEIKVPQNRRDMRCAEYSGLATGGSPIDVSAAAVGTSASPASGSSTTTVGNDLITGFLLSNQGWLSNSTNYTQRIKNSFGDDMEDQQGVATSTATNYQPTLTASGNWVSTNIAWKAANGAVSTNFSVTLFGSGSGNLTVTGDSGSPPLSCTITAGTTGPNCSTFVASGSTLNLTAAVPPGSSFGGWLGACAGNLSPTCKVANITSNQNVTAISNLSGQQAYYVNPTGSPTSSDTLYDGTCPVHGATGCTGAGQGPWQTINKAIRSNTLGASGTTIHVAAGTYNNTANSNCLTSVACFTRGGASASQLLSLVCDSPNYACILTTPVWFNGAGNIVIGGIGAGFDIGNMPAQTTAVETVGNAATPTSYNNIRLIGNYIHDVGQTASFGGITGCTLDGMITIGPAHGATYSYTGIQVLANKVLNYGLVGNGCNNAQGIYIGSAHPLIQDNIVGGISTGAIQVYDQPCDAIITNNTIFNSGNGIRLGGSSGSCGLGKNTITNNIITNIVNQKILWDSSGSSCPVSTTLYSSNTFIPSLPTACPGESGNLASSTAATFVNYQANGTGNYALTGGSNSIASGTSACVAGGTNPCVPPTDFFGAAFVNRDRGAIKF